METMTIIKYYIFNYKNMQRINTALKDYLSPKHIRPVLPNRMWLKDSEDHIRH